MNKRMRNCRLERSADVLPEKRQRNATVEKTAFYLKEAMGSSYVYAQICSQMSLDAGRGGHPLEHDA